MANPVRMGDQRAKLTLVQRGWSQRRIARELDVHRDTVGRYARMARGRPMIRRRIQNRPK